MDHQDFEVADTLGTVRKIEVLGVDALKQFVVLDLALGTAHGPGSIALGKLLVPIELARELLVDLVLEFRELDRSEPESPN